MATLAAIMETIAAPSRRSLPPVPRPSADAKVEQRTPVQKTVALTLAAKDTAAQGPEQDAAGQEAPPAVAADEAAAQAGAAEAAAPHATVRLPRADHRRGGSHEQEPGQRFVARLRAAAPSFARAAQAESAVVPEAVPPARHRRSRCRVVLRHADGEQVDVTFLGPAARGQLPTRFHEQIEEWLRSGQPRDPAWLRADPDAAGGHAIDLTAWNTGR